MSWHPTGGAATGGSAESAAASSPRSYRAFIRLGVLSFGSRAEYRGGRWYDDSIVEFPAPTDAFRDRYGLQETDSLSIVISDDGNHTRHDLAPSWRGQTCELDLVTSPGGSAPEIVASRKMRIGGYKNLPGAVELQLTDFAYTGLESVYPPNVYSVDDWPELYADHAGRTVPVVIGQGRRVPLTYVETNSGVGPYVYSLCHVIGDTPVVQTLYRGAAIYGTWDGVDVKDNNGNTLATVGTQVAGGITHFTLTFDVDQRDASQQLYDLTVDLAGGNDRNCVAEISRLLTVAGFTPDASTFGTADTWCDDNNRQVDIAYREQRTLSAIVNDLLFICQGNLYRIDSGAVAITQDAAKGLTRSFVESRGEAVEITEYSEEESPAAVSLRYKPRSDDPSQLTHTIRRTVSGGTGAEAEPALVEYLSDHTAADALLCYLALRAQYAGAAQAVIGEQQVTLGERVSFAGTAVYSGAKEFLVRSVSRPANANELELDIYDANIYTYTPGTLPADAVTGYEPDYGGTPPAEPTDFTIVSSQAVIETGGKVSAEVTLKAIPPTVNWVKMWFQVSRDPSGPVFTEPGEDVGGGYYGTTIGGLAPGVSYVVYAWAENSNGIEGLASSLPHTSATDSTVPATLSAPVATQQSGKTIRVKWAKSTDTDTPITYTLYRSVNGGADSNLGDLSETLYVDTSVSYGSTYKYRVTATKYRVTDSTGITSTISSYSNTVTMSTNIGNTDFNSSDPLASNSIVGTLTAKTINASTFRTATSGQRVEITSASNEITIHNSSGTEWGSFGVNDVSGDDTLIYSFTTTLDRFAWVHAQTTSPILYIENASTGDCARFYSAAAGGSALRTEKIGSGYSAQFYGGSARNVYVDLGIDVSGPIRWYNGSTWIQMECYDANNLKLTSSAGGAARYVILSGMSTTPG